MQLTPAAVALPEQPDDVYGDNPDAWCRFNPFPSKAVRRMTDTLTRMTSVPGCERSDGALGAAVFDSGRQPVDQGDFIVTTSR